MFLRAAISICLALDLTWQPQLKSQLLCCLSLCFVAIVERVVQTFYFIGDEEALVELKMKPKMEMKMEMEMGTELELEMEMDDADQTAT